MIIVCHVIFQDYMIKGHMALRAEAHQGGSINILQSLMAKGTVVVDIMILFCHVISQDHVIKESYGFMGRSVSR